MIIVVLGEFLILILAGSNSGEAVGLSDGLQQVSNINKMTSLKDEFLSY